LQLFDTHAHLDFARFDRDRDEVIDRAKRAGLINILTVGADLSSSRRAIKLAKHYKGIVASVGLHPHDASQFDQEVAREIKELAQEEEVKAIGETGLDYHYDNSPREEQRKAFRSQLRLANMLNKPVIIHSREAEEDTLAILKEEAQNLPGVIHCYSSSSEMAQEVIALGFHLGFTGLLTFKNLSWLREIASQTPVDKILLETDCPYMAPEPKRGKRNEPAFVTHVAEVMADCHGIPVSELAEITTENGLELFALENQARLEG